MPISAISWAMIIAGSYGTQTADLAGIFTVLLGPALLVICGIGLLRNRPWAWFGAVLLALLALSFSLTDFLRQPSPPVVSVSASGTVSTVYSSGGGMAALPALLGSSVALALLMIPSVRARFRRARGKKTAHDVPPWEASAVLAGSDPGSEDIQREILSALHGGAEFRTAHKEGGTTISWRHGRYVREDYGDWTERAEFTDDREFLAFLRHFFDWQSCGPLGQQTPEPERWRNIRNLLDDGSPKGGAAFAGMHGPGRFLRVADAFLLAAAAVGGVVWLRGGIHYRSPARRTPPPAKLDTVNGTPPQVAVPKFNLPKDARKNDAPADSDR